MATRLSVLINDDTRATASRFRLRYGSLTEATRRAYGIAAVIVEAWENGWPVIIERPGGQERLVDAPVGE